MKILALIPARGSSKSIKFKNLIKIKGISLLEKNYRAVKKSKITKYVFCSTESKKIISLCDSIGIETINRPKSLSKDDTNIVNVAKHALNFLKKEKNLIFDIIVLLQPTYPFITHKDISKTLKKLKKETNSTSCQSIHQTPHSYHYLNTRIVSKNLVKFKFEKSRIKKFNKQRKDKTYNFGNLVITKVKNLLKEKTFFTKKSTYVVIDRYRSFDLDDKKDLKYLKNFR